MNSVMKILVFWAVILLSAFLLWQTVKSRGTPQTVSEISYSDFMVRVACGGVSRVTIKGSEVSGAGADGSSFHVILPPNQSTVLEALQQHGVQIWFKDTRDQNWPNWLLNPTPLILLAVLGLLMIRQVQRRRSGSDGSSTNIPPQESKPRFGP